uniref:Cathepsin L n=1 Tax=Timema tahoe TaxID=61484 RepID=A0A7R9FI77_9NEOP|nr:unnamed protein product [Timema tahoe]
MRAQCYDGASNMRGPYKGVETSSFPVWHSVLDLKSSSVNYKVMKNVGEGGGLNQDQNQVAYGALETLDLITNRSISTMRLLLLIAAFVAVCAAVPISEEVHSDWSLFKTKHSKQYDTEEEENVRFLIFIENRNMIFEHNKKYEEGLVTYKMALNHLADMVQQSREERLKRKPLVNRKVNLTHSSTFKASGVSLPETVDWRDQGYVTAVKDQGQCGACWAFSTTGAVEGQHFKATNQLVSLSEQNLIDCATDNYYNDGCDGGDMLMTFQYIIDNGGIDSEECYPFEGKNKRCRFENKNVVATISSYVNIKEGDEEAMKEAVATIGPLAIAFDASQDSFDFYDGGIYNEQACTNDPYNLDHAMLVVGYGTENGQDYWLIKNSWGPDWGINGYMTIVRNSDNQCGVASETSYPVMKIFLILATLLVAAQAISFFDLVMEEWTTYKLEHEKQYESATEEKFRLKIFMENRNKIAKHNARFEKGEVTYKVGMNKYGDMLHHEFVNTLNGFNRSLPGNSVFTTEPLRGASFIRPANVKLPNSVDWREKGAVTPVKNQGHCGSCWSFSATGSLEGQHFRNTGFLVSLSEQNLIDCSTKYGNNGCNGGMMDFAFAYIKDNKGTGSVTTTHKTTELRTLDSQTSSQEVKIS